MEKVFEIYIRTTPERLWQAITDPDVRSKYHFGNRVSSDFAPGSHFEMTHEGAPGLLGEGKNLEVDPPKEAGPEHDCALGPGREERGHLENHLADRAGRRLLPPDGDSRPAARRGQRPALWRLADDPFRPEDVDRDRQAAHHPWITDVRLNLTSLRAGLNRVERSGIPPCPG
jgi:hypothetical protein